MWGNKFENRQKEALQKYLEGDHHESDDTGRENRE